MKPSTPQLGSWTINKTCYLSAAILLFSGAAHTVLWLVDGSSLAGDVSWRKPILFGFSAGVTVLSIGWVFTKLRPRAGDRILSTLFALAMLIEVGLITLQTWRSVPSHFNRATPFDSAVLFGIEGLILLVTILIVDVTIRSFVVLRASRDMRLAIRGGMTLLVFACLFGFFMVSYGNSRIAAGRIPDVYGESGVMKFPHGMPIHAIQYLPILSWLLFRWNVPEEARTQSVGWALAGIVAFTLFSLLQTFGGRARFEMTWGSGFVLAVSTTFLIQSLRSARIRDAAGSVRL